LLALLLYHLEVGRTVAISANAQIGLVVLVLALLFVDRLIATFRWFSLLRGLAPAICYARLALAMLIGCPTAVSPATEAITERGVGSLGRMARWYQAR
jgi:hypothetical protein